jgi:UDP-glucose 4-epimerase
MDAAPTTGHILLTGGRGRLAGVIQRHFTGRGARLTSLSRQAGDGHAGLGELFAGGTLERADTLMHLAWSTVPFSSELNPGLESEQDIPLLRKLLEAVAARPDPGRLHFIFFSSGGTVYGNARGGVPSRETDVCAPIGRYGQAKLAAEQLVGEFAGSHGLTCTILRISNPYGFPVPTFQPQGIVPFILKSARAGTPLSVWGDGTARKDFLYHTDFSTALEKIVARRPTGVFNVSSGESHTINELIQLAGRSLGQQIKTVHEPAHPWDVHDSLLDNSKLCMAMDWQPLVTIAEGIGRAVHGHD